MIYELIPIILFAVLIGLILPFKTNVKYQKYLWVLLSLTIIEAISLISLVIKLTYF